MLRTFFQKVLKFSIIYLIFTQIAQHHHKKILNTQQVKQLAKTHLMSVEVEVSNRTFPLLKHHINKIHLTSKFCRNKTFIILNEYIILLLDYCHLNTVTEARVCFFVASTNCFAVHDKSE